LKYNDFDDKYIIRDVTDREFLEYLYKAMLFRIVSKEEFNTWINKTNQGLSWEGVLKDFTNSSMFHQRIEKIINSVVAEGLR